MKKVTLFAALAVMVSFMACNNSKNGTNNNAKTTTQAMQDEVKELANFPAAAEGMERYVIVLEPKEGAEDNYQIELIPGKTMEVDCNRHGLNGAMSEKTVEGFGYTYYQFETNGQVVSTQMACPDNKKTEKFIQAKSVITRYNSKLPVVVYAPKGFELKYRLWAAGELVEANEATAVNADKEAESVKNLAHFPKAEKGQKRFVYIPAVKGDMDAEFAYKMEIVPGMVAEVDCNRHRLGGKLSEQDLKGFGYTYYDFASDGNIASTMMACPDNTKTKQFVTAPSEIVRYNSRLPLIVYAPEKFDVKFKVWEAKEMRNAIVQ